MKKSFFALVVAFVSILLFVTVSVAGKSKNEKKDKIDVCHITGTYDFGEGDVPIGHVISIAKDALLAHRKHGDTENWDTETLPDGREVCYESIEVCHLTGETHNFGDGNVPIGQVMSIPLTNYLIHLKNGDHGDIANWVVVTLGNEEVCYEPVTVCHLTGETYDFGDGDVPIGDEITIPYSYYKIHIGHGDPETYKVVTLPDDGSEVCLALEEEETQFSKGIALFGYKTDDGRQFTKRLSEGGKMSWEVTKFKDPDHNFGAMAAFYLDGKQYIMGISTHSNLKGGVYYLIRQILPSGDIGPHTHGYFIHYYKKLIPVTMCDGRVFIFMQEDGNGNRACVKQILPGGKLGPETWHDYWIRYYDTATALPLNHGRPIFFIHNSHHNNPWHIACLTSEGKVYIRDTGDWGYGYQVATSYRQNGPYLLAHRHRYDSSEVRYYGPRMIRSITDNSYMGGLTTTGEWHNFYKTLTLYGYPSVGLYYVIGHNTDKRWFTERVDVHGHIYDDTADHGTWSDYYEYLFPIDYDADTYAKVDNWMEHLNDVIGDRKLHQIALPGSHDAGMNEDDRNECHFGNSCNTVTQLGDIAYQLEHGSRYFDIRPMVPGKEEDYDGTKWCTGHGTVVADDVDGCQGECKESIIDALVDFFENNKHPKELVILKISHFLKKPGTHFDGTDWSDNQMNNLMIDLASRLDEFTVKCDNCDITDMTLNELLALGNIILVGKGTDRDTASGRFKWGYGDGYDYFNYDEYSNTDIFETMKDDQIQKLLDPDNHRRNDIHFLLSWTLTLQKSDAIACLYDTTAWSILDLAGDAQPRIFEFLYELVEEGKLTKTLFPNILYVDAFWRTQTNAAIYLNKVYNTLPD